MIFDQNQSLKNYLRSLEYRKKKYKKTIKTLKLGLIWKNVLKVKNKTNFGHLEKQFIQQAWKKTFLTKKNKNISLIYLRRTKYIPNLKMILEQA